MFYQSKSNQNLVVNMDHVRMLKVEQDSGYWTLVAVFEGGHSRRIERDSEERNIRNMLKYLLDRLDYRNHVVVEEGTITTCQAGY